MSRKTVRLNPRAHAKRNLTHLRLRQIGADPDWIVEGQCKHWGLRSDHIAGFQNAVLNDAIRGSIELRIGQLFLRQGQSCFVGLERGLGRGNVFLARADDG